MKTQTHNSIQDKSSNSHYHMLPAVVEAGIELSKGTLVYFIGEKAPMEVKAVN